TGNGNTYKQAGDDSQASTYGDSSQDSISVPAYLGTSLISVLSTGINLLAPNLRHRYLHPPTKIFRTQFAKRLQTKVASCPQNALMVKLRPHRTDTHMANDPELAHQHRRPVL